VIKKGLQSYGIRTAFSGKTCGPINIKIDIGHSGANFKTPTFAQSLRHAQILILEIFYIFLQLNFSPYLTLNKIERFETASQNIIFD
jgi:hypothetical protein